MKLDDLLFFASLAYVAAAAAGLLFVTFARRARLMLSSANRCAHLAEEQDAKPASG
jgi:hypothetical protein